MSTELINRISIKKDGVYASTHSNNDTSPYHSVKIDIFTEAYLKGGQVELDKKIIDMYFYNCDFRGNHKSIIPYTRAIERAVNDKEFLEKRANYDELNDKAFYIANRFREYKDLSKEEANKLYEDIKPDLEKARDARNEYVAKFVAEERQKINGPREIADGIYEIIPIHNVSEGLGEIYSEYMNFNANNGTITYEKRLGHLMPSSDVLKISEYQELINKKGIENISGAKEFKKFIHKYPQIYLEAIENENVKSEEKEEVPQIE